MSNQLASVWAARTASRSNRFPAVVLYCRSIFGMAGIFLSLCFFCEAKGDIVWTIGTVTIQKSDLRSDQVNRVSVPVYASSVHSFQLSGYNFSFEVGSDNLNGENSVLPHGIEFDATNPSHVGASNSLLTAGWNLDTNAYPTQLQRQGRSDYQIGSGLTRVAALVWQRSMKQLDRRFKPKVFALSVVFSISIAVLTRGVTRIRKLQFIRPSQLENSVLARK